MLAKPSEILETDISILTTSPSKRSHTNLEERKILTLVLTTIPSKLSLTKLGECKILTSVLTNPGECKILTSDNQLIEFEAAKSSPI